MFLTQHQSFCCNFQLISRKSNAKGLKSLKTIQMNSRLILVALVVLTLASCSSAYRTGQTPDDVYYSPGSSQEEYVVVDQDRNRRQGYNEYYNPDDNYLRMMVRNRTRWSAFDNYYMMDPRFSPYNFYNPYMHGGFSGYGGFGGFGGYSGFGGYNGLGGFGFYSPWSYNPYFNSYWMWNSYYNPYGYHYTYVNPKTNPAGYTRLKSFNPGAYRNSNYSNSNVRTRPGLVRPSPSGTRYNNSNNNNNNQLGNSLKKVFNNNTRSNNTNNYEHNRSSGDRPVRSYSPSSNNTPTYRSSSNNNSSSSSSSSGSSSGGSRSSSSGSRPSRGGN